MWIKQHQQYMPLNGMARSVMLIEEKTTRLFYDLKQKVGESVARTFSLQVMDGSCISRFMWICTTWKWVEIWRCIECRTRMQFLETLKIIEDGDYLPRKYLVWIKKHFMGRKCQTEPISAWRQFQTSKLWRIRCDVRHQCLVIWV